MPFLFACINLARLRRLKPTKPVTPEKVDALHQWKSGPSPNNLPVMGLPTRAAMERATNGRPILIPISPTLRAKPACTAGSNETACEVDEIQGQVLMPCREPKRTGLTVCSGEEAEYDRKADHTRCITASEKDPVKD